MKKPSYLIVGANFINKGAEAMLKTVAHEIINRHPQVLIYCICHKGEKSVAEQQGFIPLFVEFSPMQVLWKKIDGKLRKLLGKKPVPFADFSPMDKISTIENLVAAVDVSGFAYGDKRGYLQPLETIKIIEHCQKVGAKYYFMPQAWGSFVDKDVADNCRKMISMADQFFARDEVSRKYLSELLSTPIEQIPLLPDIALHFPIPSIDGLKILQRVGFNKQVGRKVLIISPNMRVYERSKGLGVDNAYVQLLTGIINKIRHTYDVILVPNEILPQGMSGYDDQYLCNTIYESLENKKDCYHIPGYFSAEAIKAIIREADLVVASRFHSLVFALSLGIPCIAISWAHKYRELFKLFGMEEYVVEDKHMNEKDILGKIEKIEQELESWTLKIKSTLPELKAKNAYVFDLLN